MLPSPGALSEDPHFPKVQWPPRELCSACHNELSGKVPLWDLGATLNFLKAHFSPSNIVIDSPAAGATARRGTQNPKLVMDTLKLETRNSVWGHEQAASAESPGAAAPDVPAEKPEASGPQELYTGLRMGGASPGQGSPEHEEGILQRDVQENAQGQHHVGKRDTEALLLPEVKHLQGPLELRRGRRSPKQLASILEGEPEALAVQGQGQWLEVLGGGVSHLDISLCVGLYSVSFMGLLAMYTYFRARMRAPKGHASYPTA